MKRLLPILAVGAMILSGASITNNVNAATAGVDMVDACKLTYQAAWKVEVTLVEQNVMGWKCMINGYSYKLDINVGAWCKHKYGNGARSKYSDFNDPYSWYCEY